MPAPTQLGKYAIRRQIGKGSMGIVYEGFDPLIQRSVAVKVIRESELGAAQAADLLARLRREAQAAGRLNHPNIVAIYDYGEDTTGGTGNDNGGGSVAYIAMELAEGRELKDCFDSRQRFTPQEIERLMGGILAALQHAHDRGVTHRDVKPANVILLPDGQVKVADFGVARIEASELTQAGTMIGTPLYMSPEQIMGYAVDGRSDLFACGVILYQFLTGEKPFTGSVTTVMQKVLHEDPVPPTQRNLSLAPVWDAVLSQAMAKKPADRFQTADEFAAAIHRAVLEQGADATVVMPRAFEETLPTRPPVQPEPPAAPAPNATPAAPPAALPAPSRRTSTVVMAAVVAAAAAVGAYQLLPGRDAPKGTSLAQAPASAPVAVAPPPPPASLVSAPAPAPPGPAASVRSRIATPPASAAPAPAPKVSAPVAPPAAPVVPPPAPPEPANDWARQLARVESLGPHTLGNALVLLLDVRSTEDMRLLADLDSALAQLPKNSALAMGVIDGQLYSQLQHSMPLPAGATGQAMRRCSERTAVPCSLVVVNGEFRRRGFVDMARGLGSKSVASVREATLRAAAQRLQALRPSAGLASAPAAASAAQASAAPASATPTAEWRESFKRLQAGRGRLGMAEALGALLNVQSAEDQKTLADFEAGTKRLRWKSALAVGEREGRIVYHMVQSEAKSEWAADNAVARCTRAASRPCALMMSDGKFIDAGLIEMARHLGKLPQTEARSRFLASAQRDLRNGL